MAAGGFRTFIPGETLDEDKINDFLMQGILVFDDAAARDAAITSPVEGQFVFLKDSDSVEFFDGSDFVEFSGESPAFDFLVIAGGGGGGRGAPVAQLQMGSGGGAGGYINSVSGELTGGSATAVPSLRFNSGQSFTVTVGAGGAGSTTDSQPGSDGNSSVFGPIVSVGGGAGHGMSPNISGRKGGSGSGRYSNASNHYIGEGIVSQGSNGGTGVVASTNSAAGGGGAGAVGGNSVSTTAGGPGGAGLPSSITGSSVTRGGGGGGGAGTTGGAGGTGGGGAGASSSPTINATSGTTNTGGGGGGSEHSRTAGSGGSGIVMLKYPDSITLTIGAGLTSSTASAGGFKVTTFTAGTDTVSF